MAYKMKNTQYGFSMMPSRSIRLFIFLVRLIFAVFIYYGFNLDDSDHALSAIGFILCYIAAYALTLHPYRLILRKYYRKIYDTLRNQ